MFAGKRSDVVDFGGEADYSNVKWFEDRPARERATVRLTDFDLLDFTYLLSIQPAPSHAPEPQPQQSAPQYQPSMPVIEQNANFEYALSAAPNVLYQKYKQYGQVGVITLTLRNHGLISNCPAWCPWMVFRVQ